MASPHLDVNSLTTAEKILLAQELWESARADADNSPIRASHLAELARREALEAEGKVQYHSWEEVKERLFAELPAKEKK